MEAPQIAHGSGADVANVRRKCGTCAAQMWRICGANVANLRRKCGHLRRKCEGFAAQMCGICGANVWDLRRTFDVICGKVFSEPEDFSDRPFLPGKKTPVVKFTPKSSSVKSSSHRRSVLSVGPFGVNMAPHAPFLIWDIPNTRISRFFPPWPVPNPY